MRQIVKAAVLGLAGLLPFPGAIAQSKIDIPEPLHEWRKWVLHEDAYQLDCPLIYGEKARDKVQCRWPSNLRISVDKQGAQFELRQSLFSAGFVSLPGDARHWPVGVQVNAKNFEVVERGGQPAIYLQAGAHSIQGQFLWQQRPKSLSIAVDTALIDLTVDGVAVATPNVENGRKLWLGKTQRKVDPEVKDDINVKVFRLYSDEIPPKLTTKIILDVSGQDREVIMGRALPEGYVALRMQSVLPARIEEDGSLRLQLRAGSYQVEIEARHKGPVQALSMQSLGEPWPEQEIWSFEANRQNRTVQLTGAPAIDPQTLDFPGGWRTDLPAYLLSTDKGLSITEVYRGDPEASANRLQLKRKLWLDFDGRGYTLVDNINGAMYSGWRLDMKPAFNLGRAEVDGKAVLITQTEGGKTKGVEIRNSALALEAISRSEFAVEEVPIGWNSDFQHIDATLYLPPGWRLLAAMGPDRVSGSWFGQWTLWDIFLVVLIVVAVGRLYGWKWASVAGIALVLSFGEQYAPLLQWLNIVLVLALLSVIPEGRFSRLLMWYRNLSFVVIVIWLFPFAVHQAHLGLHPQLEHSSFKLEQYSDRYSSKADYAAAPPPEAVQMKARRSEAGRGPLEEVIVSASKRQLSLQDKPMTVSAFSAAQISTGPGKPNWSWNGHRLSWHGPVLESEQLNVWLMSPTVFRAVSFLRIIAVAAFAVLLILISWNQLKVLRRLKMLPSNVLPVVLLLVLSGGVLLPADQAQAEQPNQELLQELRKRLLKTPECAPGCAALQKAVVAVADDRLTIEWYADVIYASAVSLPAQQNKWLPETVYLNGRRASALRLNKKGQLQIALDKGRHKIVLKGDLKELNELRLPAGLPTHNLSFQLKGWKASGVQDGRLLSNTLLLQRVALNNAQHNAGEKLLPAPITPFFNVVRYFQFGTDWVVTTHVSKIAPENAAASIEIPLLPGELLTDESITKRNGKALLVFDEDKEYITWRSVLPLSNSLQLRASDQHGWSEAWWIMAAPTWHIEFDGIPATQQPTNERWSYHFQPWPGEHLTLQLSRPVAAQGELLTIKNAHLDYSPGASNSDVTLRLEMLSSQGGYYVLKLPENAEFMEFLMDAEKQPLSPQDGVLQIPLRPGEQSVEIKWRQLSGVALKTKTPAVDLRQAASNIELNIKLPSDRWVLFVGGPALGPAVLIWGFLIVVALIAWGLGRSGLTPLASWQWILLGLGLSISTYPVAVLLAVWFFALAARRRLPLPEPRWQFNAMQVLLFLLSAAALIGLMSAIPLGLLGRPDMHVTGNGSSAYWLHWYQDRIGGRDLPTAWVISLPLWCYRVAMLAWSLWLAFALTGWLRWAWESFSDRELWRKAKK